ncbi:hypothetical protein HHK36_002770 [Tetracentron sinense]|uniref:Uncharacterized protein n=1 Tax=Tetracentron sinense TaxID=13715 RepID=A0A834ZRG7_TETSI|nr:hypothetical protein HHK36_002770 [Tetracentron sinense]
MNGSASECSSGCESGWTVYLDNSSLSANPCKRDGRFVDENGVSGKDYEGKRTKVEDEEEDLSMVSDASSGPPHFHEDEDYCDENGCFFSDSSAAALAKKSGKRQKIEQHRRRQEHPSFLDDTASSPVLGFSKAKQFHSHQKSSFNGACLGFLTGFLCNSCQGKMHIPEEFWLLTVFSGWKTNFSRTRKRAGMRYGDIFSLRFCCCSCSKR